MHENQVCDIAKNISELKASYSSRKESIDERLSFFRHQYSKSQRYVFKELCFCLMTPQSKARKCNDVIERLYSDGSLFSLEEKSLASMLNEVRFKNNKARYIVLARDHFFDHERGRFIIKDIMDSYGEDTKGLRDYLYSNIKGLGMKESSHFLRNIGKGDDIAILDRHVFTNMIRYGILEEIPKTLTKKKYLELEDILRNFSRCNNIPLDALDLLFWSSQTGEIFK